MKRFTLDVFVAETKAEAEELETGAIFSKSPTRAYSEGWDRVFGKKEAELSPKDKKDVN